MIQKVRRHLDRRDFSPRETPTDGTPRDAGVSFTPLLGVLFTFPSRYWCTIGPPHWLRLRGWSPALPPPWEEGRTASRTPWRGQPSRGRDCHPLRCGIPPASRLGRPWRSAPAPPSLAATDGVSVDFLSTGYWDGSVRRRFQEGGLGPLPDRFPGRISTDLGGLLPVAFRGGARPRVGEA